jgi:hypothetical protein
MKLSFMILNVITCVLIIMTEKPQASKQEGLKLCKSQGFELCARQSLKKGTQGT